MSSGPFPTCLAPGRPHGAQADTHASILRHRAPSPGDGPASSHRRGGEQAAVRLPGSRSPAAPADPAARGRPSPAGLTVLGARGPASAWCPGLGSHRRGRRSRLWSRWPGPCGQALWLRRTWRCGQPDWRAGARPRVPCTAPSSVPVQAPVALSTAPASLGTAARGLLQGRGDRRGPFTGELDASAGRWRTRCSNPLPACELRSCQEVPAAVPLPAPAPGRPPCTARPRPGPPGGALAEEPEGLPVSHLQSQVQTRGGARLEG